MPSQLDQTLRSLTDRGMTIVYRRQHTKSETLILLVSDNNPGLAIAIWQSEDFLTVQKIERPLSLKEKLSFWDIMGDEEPAADGGKAAAEPQKANPEDEMLPAGGEGLLDSLLP